MNDPRNHRNPTFRVGALIVVAVLLVIATLFYNAIKGKREYERENAEMTSAPAVVASPASAASASQ